MKLSKYLLIITSTIILFLLSGCSEFNDAIIIEPVNQEAPVKYPATVDFEYFTNNEAKFYGEDVKVVFFYHAGRQSYYQAYPVEETKDGYIIHNSKYDKFSIPDPTDKGFSPIFTMEKKNGTFQMTIEKEHQYKKFADEISGWDDVCAFYECFKPAEKE